MNIVSAQIKARLLFVERIIQPFEHGEKVLQNGEASYADTYPILAWLHDFLAQRRANIVGLVGNILTDAGMRNICSEQQFATEQSSMIPKYSKALDTGINYLKKWGEVDNRYTLRYKTWLALRMFDVEDRISLPEVADVTDLMDKFNQINYEGTTLGAYWEVLETEKGRIRAAIEAVGVADLVKMNITKRWQTVFQYIGDIDNTIVLFSHMVLYVLSVPAT